jgi:hypothetical protein
MSDNRIGRERSDGPDDRVVPAQRWHCGQMARRMRPEQRQTIVAAGFDPHRALVARFEESLFVRAWLVDDRVMAIGGIAGGLLSHTAQVWIVFAADIGTHLRPLIRAARAELAAAAEGRELLTGIDIADPAALRLAAFMGFHIAHDGPGATASNRPERQALIDAARASEDRRLIIGESQFVLMGFHPVQTAGAPSCA